jgi:hypothetical protein
MMAILGPGRKTPSVLAVVVIGMSGRAGTAE